MGSSTSAKLLSKLTQHTPTALLGEMKQRVGQRVGSYSAEQLEALKAELRRLAERVDLRSELQRLLSQIAIDVTLTIKLVPHDEAPLGVQPQVQTRAQVRLEPEPQSPESGSPSSEAESPSSESKTKSTG